MLLAFITNRTNALYLSAAANRVDRRRGFSASKTFAIFLPVRGCRSGLAFIGCWQQSQSHNNHT